MKQAHLTSISYRNLQFFLTNWINVTIVYDIMHPRRSNFSAPIPPTGSFGVREKMCVIKKGKTLENDVKKGGAVENEGIKVINEEWAR